MYGIYKLKTIALKESQKYSKEMSSIGAKNIEKIRSKFIKGCV